MQNSIAIQRKTIGEVLSQFKDIQTRLPELQKYGMPYLLVEENGLLINAVGMILSKRGKLLYETGIKAQSYYNFLHSVERTGTTVKITSNWEQSVWWLHSLHQYIQKEHYPKHNRKYTKEEEVVGALQTIPGVGLEKAQQLYGIYEFLYKSPQTLNTSDVNPSMLKAFDKLLILLTSALKQKKRAENVLLAHLKTRIAKDESALNMFIRLLVDVNYLQKEQIEKRVYYTVTKNKEDKSGNIQTEEQKTKHAREETLNAEIARGKEYKEENNVTG